MNKSSRLKKTTYSIVALALYQITLFACNLILPRFILLRYGSEYNGIVSSIVQFLNFIAILRAGVAGSTRVELYKSLANDDEKKTSSIIVATEKYMKKVAKIFIIYLLVLAITYPFIIDTTYSWINIGSLVIILGIGTFAQYFFGITYSTLLQADQKLYIYNVIQIFATIINTICSCLFIQLGFSIHLVKLISAIIFTISPIVLNIYVSKIYKLDKKVDADETALNNRGDVVAHSIANIVHENTDVVILTLFTNAKIISVYTVYNLVVNGLKQLMTIFTSSLESIFGDMWVKSEIDKMYRNLELYEYMVGVLISILFSCATALIVPFIGIYTAGVNDVNYILPIYAILILVSQMIYSFRMPYLTIVQAVGKYKETKKGAYVEALINIVISIVLVNFIGIYGVILGTLVANLFRTIQYAIFVSKNILPRSLNKIVKRLMWILFNIVIVVGVYWLICNYIIKMEIVTWKLWIINGIYLGICSLIVVVISSKIFYNKNFLEFVHMIKKIFNKKRDVI